MASKRMRLLLFLGVFFFFVGCAAKIPHVIVPDYSKRGTRLVAVMPVENSQAGPEAARMLRAKLIEELYFKGYPKIPPKLVDERLAEISTAGRAASPQSVGEMLRVDAVLYATLKEGMATATLFYAPTTVDVELEMKSAVTGESLWRVQYRAVRRNYGFSRKHLELKISQVFESAIQEVVDRALETLPDGPDAIGR